ncbi:hypothetical protein PAV_4c05140 [Paenibacillus alvei DSM 29]|nr:hypothetical protein PAV_4c05140 [Paenibacillus alvei DSM 29]
MFMGEYQHSIDDKGRLIIPAKLRDSLGTTFILTRGLDQCLFVYPMNEWEALEQKLKALPMMKADARAFTRFFFQGRANVSGISKAASRFRLICEDTLIWKKNAWLLVFRIG